MTDNHEYTHEELRCPITHELFLDPVIMEDGFAYERYAIESWLKKKMTSPLTNKEIRSTIVHPVFHIKRLVDDLLKREPALQKEQFKFVPGHMDNINEVHNALGNRQHKTLLRYKNYSLSKLLVSFDYFYDFLNSCTDIAIIKHVIANSTDLNIAVCRYGYNTLHYVLRYCNAQFRLEIVKMCTETGKIKVNETISAEGMTPMHYACLYSDLPVIEYLISIGGDLTKKNDAGRDCLTILCSKPRADVNIFKLLLSKGAKVPDYSDDNSNHPVMLACGAANTEILTELLTMLPTNTKINDELLNTAVENSNIGMVKFLLEKDSELLTSSDKMTHMVYTACTNADNELLKYLLEKKPKINWNYRNPVSASHIIHEACKNGCLDTVKVLIENKADLEVIDAEHMKPIHLACRAATCDMVKLLLEAKVDCTVRDAYGMLPAKYVGSNYNRINFDKETILTLMGGMSKDDLIKFLRGNQ
jgi:ankyrin repeat protein